MKASIDDLITKTDVTATFTGDAIPVVFAKRFAAIGEWTVDTNAAVTIAETDFAVATNIIFKANHGYKTGVKGVWTTSDTLPTEIDALAADTAWIIRLTADTFKVASSLANALNGTAVDFSDDGTGNHTFTPTAAAATAYLEATLTDPTNAESAADWFSITSTENISGTGSKLWEFVDKCYHSIRIAGTITAGSFVWDGMVRAENVG